MKISIIIPLFNVEEYIGSCLQSVIHQTYKGEIECLIVNDCSTDQSFNIAQSIVSEYCGNIKFTILNHEKNRGLSAARNTGLSFASGEYIYFLDSDDWIEDECIEKIVKCMTDFSSCDAVFAGARATNGEYQFLNYEDKDLPSFSNNPHWIMSAMLSGLLSVTAWNKLIKRSIIAQNNLLFAEGYLNEDDIWNLELAQKVSKIAICRENIYNYRIRDNSIIQYMNSNLSKKIDSKLRVLKKQISLINDDYRTIQVRMVWNRLLDLIRSDISLGQKRYAHSLLKDLLLRSSISMVLPVFISYLLPYQSIRYRIINWFYSKFDKFLTNRIPPVV